MFSPVKEEVRTLLTNRHITKFTMRPVKRTYAFEDKTLPRGQQYVLKVKFPASHAPLPLGLTGMMFYLVLTEQDALLSTHMVVHVFSQTHTHTHTSVHDFTHMSVHSSLPHTHT